MKGKQLFTTISIEIGSLCNRKCWFCPNHYHQRPNEFMPLDTIKDILNQLKEINYDKRIELYIYNEPFLDKRLYDIIALCRKIVPKSTIMIATNGDRIKKASQIQKLFDKGLNQLQVNVYSNTKRFRFLSGLLMETTAKPGNVYDNTSPKKQVFSIEPKYDRKVTPASAKLGRFELSNRSGNVPSIPKPRMPLDRICVRPFRLIQINWKGEVILCCNDYYADVVCGNINEASVTDIWYNSKVLNRYRKSLLNDDRKGLKLCDVCSFTGGSYTHFIRRQWKL